MNDDILFIHLPVYKHLDCFHILAIMSDAVMNMSYKYVFETLLVILDMYPETNYQVI